eukprot:179130-Chlamydomonas_euryale.AAC.1
MLRPGFAMCWDPIYMCWSPATHWDVYLPTAEDATNNAAFQRIPPRITSEMAGSLTCRSRTCRWRKHAACVKEAIP